MVYILMRKEAFLQVFQIGGRHLVPYHALDLSSSSTSCENQSKTSLCIAWVSDQSILSKNSLQPNEKSMENDCWDFSAMPSIKSTFFTNNFFLLKRLSVHSEKMQFLSPMFFLKKKSISNMRLTLRSTTSVYLMPLMIFFPHYFPIDITRRRSWILWWKTRN